VLVELGVVEASEGDLIRHQEFAGGTADSGTGGNDGQDQQVSA
jgi:hypothetical protein